MTADLSTYPGHRFPAAIISYAVWLYHVFSLSLRDVELILAERGRAVQRFRIAITEFVLPNIRGKMRRQIARGFPGGRMSGP